MAKKLFLIPLIALVLCVFIGDAYDPLDPNGNITITWDIMSWTPDGYVATVTMNNYQRYRQIQSPGWKFGWTWAKKEVIWAMVGAQAIEQGDCSRFKQNVPHCCKKKPVVIDLMKGVPYNQQVVNCCKSGVLTAYGLDPAKAIAAFQISAGNSGNNNKTVRSPRNFMLQGPGPGYTCSPARQAPQTKFISVDGRRQTQSLMTWKVTCTYSQTLASRVPTCCVSLSAFYSSNIVRCPTCSCGCMNKATCVDPKNASQAMIKPVSSSIVPTSSIMCTKHMCPIRIHWHIMLNYKQYWRVKITANNFNYGMNYTDWNMVIQHPNMKDIQTVFSFNHTDISTYGHLNDTVLLWGLNYFNDMLVQGPSGYIQSEILFKKNPQTFTLKQGWAFPQRVYFNGDACILPSPDDYPPLPNSSSATRIQMLLNAVLGILAAVFLQSLIF